MHATNLMPRKRHHVNKNTRRDPSTQINVSSTPSFQALSVIDEMSIEASLTPPGSPMTGIFSGPSTEPIRTISASINLSPSSSSDLSSLSLLEDSRANGTENVKLGGGNSAGGKKRPRDSSAIDGPPKLKTKKIKVDGEKVKSVEAGEAKEKGAFCHQ